MKKIILCLWFLNSICFLCLSPPPLSAGMKDNLEKAFEVLGMPNNITEAGGYQDQLGGFYTGGSVFARSKANNADLFSVQLPHYRAGCGGIDIFTGGFSYINVKEFTDLLRSIGSGTLGYAFSLALATVTPQIKSTLDGLAAAAREINNQNINSCEAAATLAGGAWPQSDASSEILCNALGNSYGKVSDWVQSRQKCGAEGQRDQINSKKNEKPEFKDILGDEFNIAWKAIQKNGFLSKDSQLAEFFMTISGTIVSRKNKENLEVKYFPSKSTDPNMIKALIMGQTDVEIYKCDKQGENECLNLTFQKLKLPKENALYWKVHNLLSSMSAKIRTDTALEKEEKALVRSTMIPILKILAVEAVFKEGGSPLSVSEFSEAIAYDILMNYLEEVMSLVLESVTQLQKVQIDDKTIEKFKSGIGTSRKLLFAKRTALFEQMVIILDIIERTQQIEAKLQNMFISSQQGTQVGGQ